MKPLLATFVILVSWAIEGCSSVYVLTTAPQQTPYFTTQYLSYEELMAKGKGEDVTVSMTEGNQVRGRLIMVDSASIAWTDGTAGPIHTVPISRVRRLELSRNYIWEGCAVGIVAFTVPLLASGAWGANYPSRLDEPDYSWRYLTVIGGVLGGLVGGGVGSAIKTTDSFLVVPPEAQGVRKPPPKK